MTAPDHIIRDIARKCADDVAAAIKRNMALIETPEGKLSVSLSASASAMGTTSGTYLAMLAARDQPPVHHLAAADGVWHSLRPMILRVMAALHAANGTEEPEWFPLPNPFAPVDILPADRDALYGGLISAGHPATYARHMAYDMPDDDGSLQMLARHRLAHVSPALDHAHTYHRINELMEEGGFWKPCCGCQESVDGCVSINDYPYDPLFRCQPGSGCHECGGIGVIWDDGRGYADITWDEVAPALSDVIPVGEVEPRRFVDCPPGLFRWAGKLCFKSEYWSKAGQPDAYCVDSGEYFWGGTNGDIERRCNLMVVPVAYDAAPNGNGGS